jgi:uncharacterized protein (TIRG00374 family)
MNMHIPQSGNVYEAYKTNDKFGVSLTEFTSGIGAVNWFSACFNCLASTLLIVVLGIVTDFDAKPLLKVLLLILITLIFVPLILEFIFNHVGDRPMLPLFHKWLGIAHQIVKNMREDLMVHAVFFRLLLWNSLFFIANATVVFLGFHALGQNLSFADIMLFVILNSIVGLISLLPGNIGIIEYAYGAVGTLVNLPPEIGILVAVFFRMASYIVFILLFIVFWLISKRSLTDKASL